MIIVNGLMEAFTWCQVHIDAYSAMNYNTLVIYITSPIKKPKNNESADVEESF